VTREWNRALLAQLDIPSHFLSPIVDPAAGYGATGGGTPVFAAAGHDTASAVAAVPAAPGATWAYISSGTWSLVGVERPQPLLTTEALHMKLSNEIGVGRQTRLLKNVMGLWLVQECRRSLARTRGDEYGYEQLTALAEAAPGNGPLVDGADHRFITPDDMPSEIRKACIETGQTPPEDVAALIRCCLDSLALAYRRTLTDLERVLDVRFDVVHIVGGGTKNRLLNQLAANACGIPVVAGPAEATAAGNVLAQMVGCGEVADWSQARQVSLASFQPETFVPDPSALDAWRERDAAFAARQAPDA
jgi:rhamnulokinase